MNSSIEKGIAISCNIPIKDLKSVKHFRDNTINNINLYDEKLNRYDENKFMKKCFLESLIDAGIIIQFIFSHKFEDNSMIFRVYAGFYTLLESDMDLIALCLYEVENEEALIRKLEANPKFIFEEDIFNMTYPKDLEGFVEDLLEPYKHYECIVE